MPRTTKSTRRVHGAGLPRHQPAEYLRDREALAAAIHAKRIGTRRGWLSAATAARVVEDATGRAPHRARLAMLIRSLGYVVHPALPQGRTYMAVVPDTRRCTLYAKPVKAAATAHLNPPEVLRAYAAAQV